MADDPEALVHVPEVLDVIRDKERNSKFTRPLRSMRREILRMLVVICLEKNFKTSWSRSVEISQLLLWT